MAVHELRNQEAQHDSGAILRSHSRETVEFELHGRVMTVAVERGLGGDVFYLPTHLTWDDGEPLDPSVSGMVRVVIAEVNAFWGSTSEFRPTEI